MDPLPRTPALQILLVCTANRCRSPVAERLLWRELVLRSVPASVLSAGFLERGEPADDTMREVMAQRGIDLAPHRSERVTVEELTDADLVLTMERRHAREIVLMGGPHLPVHTLKGFVDLARGVPRRGDVFGWLEDVTAARSGAAFVGDDRADEIADPIGRPDAVHRRIADAIEHACRDAAALLAGEGVRTTPS